ncbi:hypothetical protein PFISCL1PPCAC_14652, partial [Pristionchus fissidentatus]
YNDSHSQIVSFFEGASYHSIVSCFKKSVYDVVGFVIGKNLFRKLYSWSISCHICVISHHFLSLHSLLSHHYALHSQLPLLYLYTQSISQSLFNLLLPLLPMNTRPCLICTSPTLNAHLGVDACRACAAFYKRTLSSGRIFTCRQGKGKCRIRKKEPFLCRKCRFDRCKELGMVCAKKDEKEEEIDPIEGTSRDEPNEERTEKESILKKILREYKFCCENRRKSESELRSKAPDSHIRVIDKPNEIIYLSKSTFASECMRILIEGLYLFATRSFPSFSSLSSVEQCLIIGKCTSAIFVLEGNFLAKKYFDSKKYFMVSLTSSLHLDALNYFLSDEKAENKEEIVKAMRFYTEKQIDFTWPLLQRAQLTETELAVLISTIIWQFGFTHSIPLKLCSLGEEILSEIYSDLHRYYRDELGLVDYSTRLGNLLSLSHSMVEASATMEEEFTLYSLMDLFQPDAFIRKLFA